MSLEEENLRGKCEGFFNSTSTRFNTPHLGAYLASGVSFSQSGAVRFLVHCIKIHGDTEGDGYLVRSRVTPANRTTGVIHFVRNIQLCQRFSFERQRKSRFMIILEVYLLHNPLPRRYHGLSRTFSQRPRQERLCDEP